LLNAYAAMMAALVFGSSLAHVIDEPLAAGWNWDVAAGHAHSGDISAAASQGRRRCMCRRVVVPAWPVLAWTRSQTWLTSHRPLPPCSSSERA
jgi:hypothetical protein